MVTSSEVCRALQGLKRRRCNGIGGNPVPQHCINHKFRIEWPGIEPWTYELKQWQLPALNHGTVCHKTPR